MTNKIVMPKEGIGTTFERLKQRELFKEELCELLSKRGKNMDCINICQVLEEVKFIVTAAWIETHIARIASRKKRKKK